MSRKETLTDQFERQQIDVSAFRHREHLETAYGLLRKYPFVEALSKYAETIRALATTAGAPEKFNLTITLGFLSLVAERIDTSETADFDAFLAENDDLGKDVLSRWYSSERLRSHQSRRIFLLPDRVQAA